jgi:two-component system nitrate/nitrite response regulator NarL
MDELLRAIEEIHAGNTYFNSNEARAAFAEHSQNQRDNANQVNSALSCRELEVLSKIAGGGSTREIAAELGIGVRTVETHRERIMQKLQIHSIAGLTRFAIVCGVANLESLPKNADTAPSTSLADRT